jgi:hypothetical protein
MIFICWTNVETLGELGGSAKETMSSIKKCIPSEYLRIGPIEVLTGHKLRMARLKPIPAFRW